jgi:hypothetical protein
LGIVAKECIESMWEKTLENYVPHFKGLAKVRWLQKPAGWWLRLDGEVTEEPCTFLRNHWWGFAGRETQLKGQEN